MTGRLMRAIKRAALSVPAFVQHVPNLIRERDALRDHALRLDQQSRELAEDVRRLEEERDSLRGHLRRLEAEVRCVGARPGSYGSPVVDPESAEARRAMETQRRWEWQGAPLDLDEEAMIALFHRLSRHYPELRFPDERTSGHRYYFANPAFSYGDAVTLFSMMREYQPKRIVEVGAGFSSCVMMDTNDQFFGGAIDLTFIDPYPSVLLALLAPEDPYRSRLRAIPLQEAELNLFTRLEKNDILFIDSSHVAKTGSDVTDYCFRILPALRPGVLVHIHDILFPFEYPAEWVARDKRSWNEVYLLRAFLQYNNAFRVIFFNDWFYNKHRELTRQHMPRCVESTGGSIWLQRR